CPRPIRAPVAHRVPRYIEHLADRLIAPPFVMQLTGALDDVVAVARAVMPLAGFVAGAGIDGGHAFGLRSSARSSSSAVIQRSALAGITPIGRRIASATAMRSDSIIAAASRRHIAGT